MVWPHWAPARSPTARTPLPSIRARRVSPSIQRQILGASQYSTGVSSAYGTGAGAFTSIAQASATASVDETLSFSVVANGAYNYATNNFASFR